jgi:hypothetical protein
MASPGWSAGLSTLSSAKTGRKPNFWQSVFGGATSSVKYTVANLSSLYLQLSKVTVVNDMSTSGELNPSCAARRARGGQLRSGVGKACDHGLEPSAR